MSLKKGDVYLPARSFGDHGTRTWNLASVDLRPQLVLIHCTTEIQSTGNAVMVAIKIQKKRYLGIANRVI